MRAFANIALTSCLLVALPAAGAYDANGVALGACEQEIAQRFPAVFCKPLEWTSRAADRRCDDAKASFAGVQARITFFLKEGKVQAFDVRFDARDAEQVAVFLKSRYGQPAAETRDKTDARGRSRELYRLRWERAGQQAVLSAPMQKRRAVLTVSRGVFEEEIYHVR